ncbi:MAG: hypothetical protein R6U55_06565, partial [Desulfovermiculus sp.]
MNLNFSIMKKLSFLFLLIVISMCGFSQTKPLQYKPMHIPKSNQQVMTEEMMKHATIENEIESAKKFFLQKNYAEAYKHSVKADNLAVKYFNSSHVTAIYLMGRCFEMNDQQAEANKCFDFAKKYGI